MPSDEGKPPKVHLLIHFLLVKGAVNYCPGMLGKTLVMIVHLKVRGSFSGKANTDQRKAGDHQLML